MTGEKQLGLLLRNICISLKLFIRRFWNECVAGKKLAKFHGSDSVDEFRSELLATKHLMMQTESKLGFSCAEGEVKSALDVHFYVNGAMIHVDDDTTGKEERHENFFMAEIRKTEAAAMQIRKSMAEQLEAQAPAPTPKRSYDD